MSTYRVVLKRTVETYEYFIVQGNDEDEAAENALGGHYPVVTVDVQDTSTEVMTTEEMK